MVYCSFSYKFSPSRDWERNVARSCSSEWVVDRVETRVVSPFDKSGVSLLLQLLSPGNDNTSMMVGICEFTTSLSRTENSSSSSDESNCSSLIRGREHISRRLTALISVSASSSYQRRAVRFVGRIEL